MQLIKVYQFSKKVKQNQQKNLFYQLIKIMGIVDSKSLCSSLGNENTQQQNKAFYQGQCDEIGRHHGRGTMKYTDGSVFQGIFKIGMPQKGVFKYPNGNTYDGQLKDNKPHGQGLWKQQKGIFQGQFENGNFISGQVKYSDGSYFKGTMQDMKKSGKDCFYRFKDGDTFQGEFKDDFFYYGKYLSKDKAMQYQGFFNNDSQKHGKGKLFLAEVAEYVGQFRNDQFDGQGTLKNLKTLTKYQGTFRQGKKHGFGKLFGPDDKLSYQGQFMNNEKHGKGVFYFQKKKYEGEFISGKFEGQGTLYYGNGDIYKGSFKDNKKHGKGELLLVNNTIISYKGDFVEDRFEGEGEVLYSNRDIYKGSFLANKKHGKGKYIVTENNIQFEGQWISDIKNGQFTQRNLQNETVIKGFYMNGQKDGTFQIYKKGSSLPQKETWVRGKRQYLMN